MRSLSSCMMLPALYLAFCIPGTSTADLRAKRESFLNELNMEIQGFASQARSERDQSMVGNMPASFLQTSELPIDDAGGFMSAVANMNPDSLRGGSRDTPGSFIGGMPSNVMEPGALARAVAAAPSLFPGVNDEMVRASAAQAKAAASSNEGGAARPLAPGDPSKPDWKDPLQNFGSSMDSIASHISSLVGPVPAYNGPCQCKACAGVLLRLRQFVFEWGHFGPKEINDEIDDRFCFGEHWTGRSECYYVLGNYRDLISTMLYFGMDEVSMCRMLFQCYSGEGLNAMQGGSSFNMGKNTEPGVIGH